MNFSLAESIINWWQRIRERNIERPFSLLILVGPFFITVILVVVLGVVDLIREGFRRLRNLFRRNSYRADDEARETIAAWTDDQIREQTHADLSQLVEDMLRNNTVNRDERAILRVLEALSTDCNRLAELVELIGFERLRINIDGFERTQLLSLLYTCGVIGIEDMNKRSVRYFIDITPPAELNILSIIQITDLLEVLFRRNSNNEDEDAILILLAAIGTKRAQLFALTGFERAVFQRELDGEQRRIFDRLYG